MKVLYRHYKLTTKRNWHSQGSGPLGSGPIGPGSGYSVMPTKCMYENGYFSQNKRCGPNYHR